MRLLAAGVYPGTAVTKTPTPETPKLTEIPLIDEEAVIQAAPKPVSISKAKLDEVLQAGITIFSGKELN